MWTRSDLGVIALVVWGALSCSPADVMSPDAGTSAKAACTDHAYARCSRLTACSPAAVTTRFGDVKTCEASYSTLCLNTLAAPSTGASAAGNEACTQAISSWACGDYLFNQNIPPACQTAIGHLPAGATCAFPSQCQSGFCAIVPGHACGTCARPPQPGDPCDQLTTCGPSLVCAATTLKCATFASMGASCGGGQPCGEGLNCVGDDSRTGTLGICQPTVQTLGAACDFGAAGCDFNAGLSCNTQSMVCATSQIVGDGLACGLVENQWAYCAAAGSCVAGACQAASPAGGPCDLMRGPGCINFARCIVPPDGGTSGTCRTPSASICQ